MICAGTTRRRAVAAAVGLMLLLGTVACGADDAVETSGANATTTTTTTTATTTVAPTRTEPAPSTTERRPRRTTTSLPTLPVPIAPPPPGTVEPEVLLGTIEIPAIGVTRNLYSGITIPTLDKGPGHWPGSATPGQVGNVVVAGHRTSKDRPFHDVDQLVVGDEVIFTTDEGRFVYAVTGTEIVTPDALWITGQTYDRTATLFACHPPGSTAYRIVVYAELVEPARTGKGSGA